jgi:hypothetical protein
MTNFEDITIDSLCYSFYEDNPRVLEYLCEVIGEDEENLTDEGRAVIKYLMWEQEQCRIAQQKYSEYLRKKKEEKEKALDDNLNAAALLFAEFIKENNFHYSAINSSGFRKHISNFRRELFEKHNIDLRSVEYLARKLWRKLEELK